MIFVPIDITQASKGAQRAESDAFDNLNKLIASDAAAQQNYENFAGAPGRIAATQLESDRQVQLAGQLQPQLGNIVNADAQAILGAAAARGVAGQTQSAVANFTIPNIPTLGANTAATNLARSNNSLVEASVLTPQQQAIESSRQAFSLSQEPVLQNTRAQQNQLANDLQAGESAYQQKLQQYNTAKLNGQAANLPQEQALQRERTRLDQLRTQVGQGNAQTAINTQPQRQQLAEARAKGELAREPQMQAQLSAQAQTGNNEAQYILSQQGTMQGIRTAQAEILGNNVSYQQATQAQKLAIAKLELDYDKAKKEYQSSVQKWEQDIQDTKRTTEQADAQAALDRLPTLTEVEDIKASMALGQVQFEQLSQPQKQAVITDNITIERSNTALALKELPKRQRIKTLQLGMALTDAQDLQRNQQYATTARDIGAQAAPDAERARVAAAKWTANVAAGIRALQGLSIYDAGTMTPGALANASSTLRSNNLLGEDQNLFSTPAGVVIRNKDGSPDIPIANLQRGLIATQKKATGDKTTYKYTNFVTPDGVSVPTTTITSNNPMNQAQVNAASNINTPAPTGTPDVLGALDTLLGDVSSLGPVAPASQQGGN